MSKRHYYEKFKGDIPEEIEKNYNKMVRHEEYLYEKDIISKAIFFGREEELEVYNIAEYIITREKEEKEHDKLCGRIAVLHNALELLKEFYPVEHEVIMLYYFSDRKLTLKEIGKERNITKQAIHKILKNAYEHLREYINISQK